MERKIMTFVLCGMLSLTVCGCTGQREDAEQSENAEQIEVTVLEEVTAEQIESAVDQAASDAESSEAASEQMAAEVESAAGAETESASSIFSELKYLQFDFCSGAGGWATRLMVDEDGSFAGEFFDGELGAVGEGYPNGTMYECSFSGKFTQPEKVNDCTYSMRIQEISYDREPDTEEIIDGVLYCYGTPYGLDGAEEILIYLPGAPLDQLPEEYRSWVGFYDLSKAETSELEFYGLYNEAQQCGFSSYSIIDSLSEIIAYTQEWAEDAENSIQNDPLTQLELNEQSQRIYDLWDQALNQEWNVLKRALDENEMAQLLEQQREWISMKEAAAKEAGSAYEGGSMQSMVVNLEAARLTKERVYELWELVETFR